MPQNTETRDRVRIGALDVDIDRLDVFLANSNTPAQLRPQATKLLVILARNAGELVSKQSLMDEIWPDAFVTDDSLVQAVSDIRRALGDSDHRLLRTVRGRGYRLILSPENSYQTVKKNQLQTTVSWGTDQLLNASMLQRVIASILLLAALAVCLWLVVGWYRSTASSDSTDTAPEIPGIAVFPFRELNTQTGIGKWLAEDLVHAFARDGRLRVISQYSSFAISDKKISAAEIATELNARYLVNGHVARSGEKIQIDIQLLDLRSDQVVWSDQATSDGGAIVDIVDTLKSKITGRLLTSTEQAIRQMALISKPSSLAVYDLTQRALALKHRFSSSATLQAQSLLQQAIRTDPDYAAAKAAYCWVNALDALFQLTGEWSKSDADTIIAQCQSSVALDPYPAMPYLALADAYLLAGDIQAAAHAARQATERAPGNAEAWLLYGFHLLPTEDATLASAALARALPLFPIKLPFVHLLTTQIAWASGDSALAWDSANACTRSAPQLEMCAAIKILVQVDRGQIESAKEELAQLRAKAPTFNAIQACSRFSGRPERHQACLTVLADY